MHEENESLRSRLAHEPRELRFGTSGRRGEIVNLTQLEIYINVSAELEYLKSLPPATGGIATGDEVFVAYDLRPSSDRLVPSEQGRGEICQAVVRAAQDCGMRPVNLGRIPTPALAFYAFSRQRASVMVTGSHIPFDRNGYKLNTSRGELLKQHEAPISDLVRAVRECVYGQPFTASPFDENGMLKASPSQLPPEQDDARLAYVRRYTDFFRGSSLAGKRIAVYQHSAVGRDLVVEILEALGGEVIPIGRSDTFVPIDTEAMSEPQLAGIEALARQELERSGSPLWAVVSTDGDSDRPLVLGVSGDGSLRFFGGDLVGMIVAEFLNADAVVVPISCNDGIDQGRLKDVLEPKTKIGSPYIIEGLEKAVRKGKQRVCGWEANGGFLTASDIQREGRTLAAMATRDAVLPILSVLLAANEQGGSLIDLFSRLPPRYSRSALLREVPQATSRRIVARFSPDDPHVVDVVFRPDLRVFDHEGRGVESAPVLRSRLDQIRNELQTLFHRDLKFGEIVRINYLDGLRVTFSNGDVAHVRPSGNADELRIYAVSDTQNRADEIARLAVAEPAGILRSMERLATGMDSAHAAQQ